jgi:hypothetical protein
MVAPWSQQLVQHLLQHACQDTKFAISFLEHGESLCNPCNKLPVQRHACWALLQATAKIAVLYCQYMQWYAQSALQRVTALASQADCHAKLVYVCHHNCVLCVATPECEHDTDTPMLQALPVHAYNTCHILAAEQPNKQHQPLLHGKSSSAAQETAPKARTVPYSTSCSRITC